MGLSPSGKIGTRRYSGRKAVKVQINGEPREIVAPNIAQLVADLALPAPAILVEHNGVALRRDEWDGREVRENDRIEVIRIVAGG